MYTSLTLFPAESETPEDDGVIGRTPPPIVFSESADLPSPRVVSTPTVSGSTHTAEVEFPDLTDSMRGSPTATGPF